VRVFNEVMLTALVLALVFAGSLCPAQDQPAPTGEGVPSATEQAGRIFDMKIPDGFESQPAEEAGILKWKKGTGEIFIVVGDIFAGTGEALFEALHDAAKRDENYQSVRLVTVPGGRGMVLEEKAPSDPQRSVTWRLVVVTKKNVINVDFSAPVQEFQSFTPDFQKALESFALKATS